MCDGLSGASPSSPSRREGVGKRAKRMRGEASEDDALAVPPPVPGAVLLDLEEKDLSFGSERDRFEGCSPHCGHCCCCWLRGEGEAMRESAGIGSSIAVIIISLFQQRNSM